MLVLTRKQGERIHCGDGISIKVAGIQGNRVRLVIEALAKVSIQRAERMQQSVAPPETCCLNATD